MPTARELAGSEADASTQRARAHLHECSAYAEERAFLADRYPPQLAEVRESLVRGAKEHMSRISTLAAPTAAREGLDRSSVRTALHECRPVNEAAVARATRDLLVALGADLDSEGLRETPRRMAGACLELLTPEPFNITTFPNDELVVVRDIRFQSLCMHHVLPFYGVAHVAYLPADRILGLSKLARVVDLFARDLQLQERLTTQIAGWLQQQLQPKGVGVVLEAEHLCMSLRGAQKPGAKTITLALHGLVREDPRTREGFLSLTGGRTR